MTTQDPVDLLWTGGWDSTYRLLDLVLIHGVNVQPWYVIDGDRPSTPVEMHTMDAIVGSLLAHSIEVAPRLKPTRMVNLQELEPHDKFGVMCGRLRLGSQYGWLAQLASQFSLAGVEMAIDHGPHRLYNLLWSNVEPQLGHAGIVYRLRDNLSDPNLELFRRFDFPVLNLTKSEMGARASEAGLYEILCMTWFCHEPRGGRPCGMCSTCMAAIKAGAGWRIPLARRIRPRLRILKKRVTDRLDTLRSH